jgi:hypothetical protein
VLIWYIDPDYARTDGAILLDPPKDFPHRDLSEAWNWLQKNRDREDIQLIPFDVKTGLLGQDSQAALFIVVLPGYPDYFCILPGISFATLRAVHRSQVEIKEETDPTQARLRSDGQTGRSFPDYLAPFAIHRDDLSEAFSRIAKASLGEDEPYTNPSNGVTLHGWNVPKPRCTLQEPLRIKNKLHALSRDAVARLQSFFDSHHVKEFSLLLNSPQPLVSDFILRDEIHSSAYIVEHKVGNGGGNQWFGSGTNWHFLFNEVSPGTLRIWPRGDSNIALSPFTVELTDTTAHKKIAKFIRAHGQSVKSALRNKWALHFHNSRLDREDEQASPDPKGLSNSTSASSRSLHRELCHILCDALNDQCCKLARHVFVLLRGNPCAHFLMVEHEWTAMELEAYQGAGILPTVLLGRSNVQGPRVVPIRVISHDCPAGIPTADLLEPGRQRSWPVPVCNGLKFVYIVGTGTISTTGSKQLLPRKAVLLPSEATIWMEDGGHGNDEEVSDAKDPTACNICDDKHQQRKWTHCEYVVLDRRSGGSLLQAAFLTEEATPLNSIYNLDDGALYEELGRHLERGTSKYACEVEGPHGVLQRTWMHGAQRVAQTVGASPQAR